MYIVIYKASNGRKWFCANDTFDKRTDALEAGRRMADSNQYGPIKVRYVDEEGED